MGPRKRLFEVKVSDSDVYAIILNMYDNIDTNHASKRKMNKKKYHLV